MPVKLQRYTKPLRAYQIELKRQLDESTVNTIIQAPTGSGKGNIIVEQALDYIDQGHPTLIVVPSIDLLDNLEERFREFAPDHYAVHFAGLATGRPKVFHKRLVVGVYKSVCNSLNYLPKFRKIIHEEVHHSKAKSWEKILKYYTNAQHSGYTATPERLDGKPLGDNFQKLIVSPPVQWFIDNGYLSPFTLKTAANITLEQRTFNDNLQLQQKLFNNKAQIGRAIDQWRKHAYGTKTIIFASGIDHAYALAEEFNKTFEGETVNGRPIKFAVLESELDPREREQIKRDYINNKYMGIVNVQILTEGVDIPDVETVLLCRFTYSLSLFLQMVGRALRYVPGKLAKLLDPVGNAMYHGSPSMEREWSLNGGQVRGGDFMCHCEGCDLSLIAKSKVAKYGNDGVTVICPNCGLSNFFQIIPQIRGPRVRQAEILDGDLVEFTADGQTMKLYKILTSNKKIQQKIDDVVNLNIEDESLKTKALRALGVTDNAIMIYLGMF